MKLQVENETRTPKAQRELKEGTWLRPQTMLRVIPRITKGGDLGKKRSPLSWNGMDNSISHRESRTGVTTGNVKSRNKTMEKKRKKEKNSWGEK